MRVIIAGSRDFYDYNMLKREVDEFILNLVEHKHLEEGQEIIIISGGARGTDKLGERYAKEYGYKCEVYHPDWTLGKKAGLIRNLHMGDSADACIVFILNESRGSTHMADYAYRKGLQTKVISIKS